jgi:hypothetical protein
MGVVGRAVVAGILCGMLAACSGPESTAPTTTPKLTYGVGGCAEELEPTRDGSMDEVQIIVEGETIRMEQTLTYVCCAELELTLEREGSTIRIEERNVGEICRCMCEYFVEGEVTGLDRGTYEVQVWGVEYEGVHSLELLYETQVSL